MKALEKGFLAESLIYLKIARYSKFLSAKYSYQESQFTLFKTFISLEHLSWGNLTQATTICTLVQCHPVYKF